MEISRILEFAKICKTYFFSHPEVCCACEFYPTLSVLHVVPLHAFSTLVSYELHLYTGNALVVADPGGFPGRYKLVIFGSSEGCQTKLFCFIRNGLWLGKLWQCFVSWPGFQCLMGIPWSFG